MLQHTTGFIRKFDKDSYKNIFKIVNSERIKYDVIAVSPFGWPLFSLFVNNNKKRKTKKIFKKMLFNMVNYRKNSCARGPLWGSMPPVDNPWLTEI